MLQTFDAFYEFLTGEDVDLKDSTSTCVSDDSIETNEDPLDNADSGKKKRKIQ